MQGKSVSEFKVGKRGKKVQQRVGISQDRIFLPISNFLLLWLKHRDRGNLEQEVLLQSMIPGGWVLHFHVNWELTSWTLSRKFKDWTRHMAFETSKLILRNILPPARPHLSHLLNQQHQLGTKYPNARNYGGLSHWTSPVLLSVGLFMAWYQMHNANVILQSTLRHRMVSWCSWGQLVAILIDAGMCS